MDPNKIEEESNGQTVEETPEEVRSKCTDTSAGDPADSVDSEKQTLPVVEEKFEELEKNNSEPGTKEEKGEAIPTMEHVPMEDVTVITAEEKVLETIASTSSDQMEMDVVEKVEHAEVVVDTLAATVTEQTDEIETETKEKSDQAIEVPSEAIMQEIDQATAKVDAPVGVNMDNNSAERVDRKEPPSPQPHTSQMSIEQNLEAKAVLQIANSSLKLLAQYSDSGEDSDDNAANNAPETSRKRPASSSSSSDTEDDVVQVVSMSANYREESIVISDTETMQDANGNANGANSDEEEPQPIRGEGEIFLHELPPIEELKITVPEEECQLIGKVDSIVAQIVLVQSNPGVELLNLETVLFLERGKRPLGKIFDVIGQVNCPLYCVLFNSNSEVRAKDITVGIEVFCAPRTEHTSFIILSDLMRHKGSDASWLHDSEPPSDMLEYSDDEQERAARKKKFQNRSTAESTHERAPQQQHPQRPYEQRQYSQRRPFRRNYPRQPRGGGSGYSWHQNLHAQPMQHPPSRSMVNPYATHHVPNPFAKHGQPPRPGPPQ